MPLYVKASVFFAEEAESLRFAADVHRSLALKRKEPELNARIAMVLDALAAGYLKRAKGDDRIIEFDTDKTPSIGPSKELLRRVRQNKG